ncbi:MAG: AMP-binding protein [Candidatus Binatia bacterium]|nr:AMP-binding protein [Candidatus Binatia bacterium]
MQNDSTPYLQAGGFWALIEARAAATPNALFTVDENDRRATFKEYRDAAERCAAGLQAQGVGTDSMVSWMLPTNWESLVLVAALSRLGATQNPILPIYRHKEVGFITKQAKSSLLVVPGPWRGFDYPGMAAEIAADRDGLEVMVVTDSIPDGDPATLQPPPAEVDDGGAPIRWLFYSSGTTADPKGARHTDMTLLAAARGMSGVLDLASDDRVAMVFPFTHVGGVVWVYSGLMSGCSFIVVPVFDPATTVDVLAKNDVTQATAGTAFHQAYLATQRKRREAGDEAPLFPSVRSFPGGGAPKPPQLHFDLKKEMGGAGIVSGYGMTECPILVMNSVHDPDDKLAHTEGRPCPAEVDLRVVTSDESVAGPTQEGEFRVKAPQLCKGYLDEALNEAAFDANGYFRTGDLGYLDRDGYAVITGRLKDVIIRKGENISAKEVEDLLYTHDKIQDVAVVGLPDPDTGERACAVLSLTDAGQPVSMDEMAAFLKEKGLMVQKIPEQIEIVDQIPRNATGKILKHELRKNYEYTKRGV